MGTLIVAVTPQVASMLREPGGERSTEAATLLARVAGLGGVLRPQHPGVSDASLGRWFVLDGVADPARAAEALRGHPAVDGAYVKPSAEPAGGAAPA